MVSYFPFVIFLLVLHVVPVVSNDEKLASMIVEHAGKLDGKHRRSSVSNIVPVMISWCTTQGIQITTELQEKVTKRLNGMPTSRRRYRKAVGREREILQGAGLLPVQEVAPVQVEVDSNEQLVNEIMDKAIQLAGEDRMGIISQVLEMKKWYQSKGLGITEALKNTISERVNGMQNENTSGNGELVEDVKMILQGNELLPS